MKHFFALLLTVLLWTSFLPLQAGASESFWAVDDSQKLRSDQVGGAVLKDENGVPLSQSPLNQVWQNGEVHVFGGRNEIVAFQVIAEALGSPMRVSDVSLEKLCKGSACLQNSGNTADPFDYRGKVIEIFTPNYVNTGPYVLSDNVRLPDPYYQNAPVPEAMIPIDAPSGATSLPLTIARDSSRSFWFDITVPKGTAPGVYTGTIRIQTGNGRTDIPVNLTVYDFTLPDESHLPNMFYYGAGIVAKRLQISTNSDAYREQEKKYYQLAYRHRVHLYTTQGLDELRGDHVNYLNGSYYTPAHKYAGPGEGAGHGIFAIGAFDLCKTQSCFNSRNQPDGSNKDGFRSGYSYDRGVWWSVSDEWYNWFNNPANGLRDLIIFRYMVDEPNWPPKHREYSYGKIQTYSDWMHSNPGPGRNLKTMCSATYESETIGYCDGYVFNRAYHTPEAEAYVRSRGGTIGIYNGSNPTNGAGLHQSNTSATDARVTPWVAAKYGADFYMLWQTVHEYPNYSCDFYGNDPECTQATTLIPGTDPRQPGNDPQIDGPLVTARLKYWRRGMQDREYLWLLEQAGKGNVARQAENAVVPRALYDTPGLGTPNFWSPYGYAFEAQRKLMAEALHRGDDPTGAPTSTPQPEATNTPQPEATNTPQPEATNTPPPQATNTPPPPTNTPVPGACAPDANNVLGNPGFEDGTAVWSSYFANRAARFSTESPAFECERSARFDFSGSSNNMQLYQNGFSLQPNTDYVLTFAARSSSGDDVEVYLHKHTKPYTNYGVSATVDLGTSWQTFTLPFRTDGNPAVPRLRFWFSGQAAAGDVYWLDDVRIVPADAPAGPPPTATNTPPPAATATATAVPPSPTATNTPVPGASATATAVPPSPSPTAVAADCAEFPDNLVANGGFEDGTRSWKFYTNGRGTFQAPAGSAYECEAGARLELTRVGSNVQLYQTGLALRAGATYRLSFAARSTDGRDVQVYLHKHTRPYTTYGVDVQVPLLASWREVAIVFTADGFSGSTTNSRLRFWFPGLAQNGDVYEIDNVRLEEMP